MRVVNIDQVADLYRKAFDHVCNQADWKAEIDCVVPFELANLYMQAIEFMTGVKPVGVGRTKVEGLADGYRITCIGYRRGPCGG